MVPALTYQGALRLLGRHDSKALTLLDSLLGGVILAAGPAAVGGAQAAPHAVSPTRDRRQGVPDLGDPGRTGLAARRPRPSDRCAVGRVGATHRPADATRAPPGPGRAVGPGAPREPGRPAPAPDRRRHAAAGRSWLSPRSGRVS
ncbi:hypothetical protein ACN261_11380 [Micromonospora sp. WMMD723]|uniref:NACHT N-terminal helical domain 7-containing protein n=1 Tax=Micromonospora sp. WMMD723 TaxID=3403465 RepID=UPI003CF45B2C